MLNISENGQTCLEKIGMIKRNEHILKNGWNKDMPYTKVLVDSEYNVKSEFKIG